MGRNLGSALPQLLRSGTWLKEPLQTHPAGTKLHMSFETVLRMFTEKSPERWWQTTDELLPYRASCITSSCTLRSSAAHSGHQLLLWQLRAPSSLPGITPSIFSSSSSSTSFSPRARQGVSCSAVCSSHASGGNWAASISPRLGRRVRLQAGGNGAELHTMKMLPGRATPLAGPPRLFIREALFTLTKHS